MKAVDILNICEDVIDQDKLFNAYDMGKKAHKAGKSRNPIDDKPFIDAFRGGNVGDSVPYLKEWVRGWDDSNLGKDEVFLESQEVAQEIIRQLGGNKFKVMTGASNFGFMGNKLSFKLGSGAKNGIKYCTIELTSMDDYNMKFLDSKGGVVKSYEGIFADQLQELFTEATGFYTYL